MQDQLIPVCRELREFASRNLVEGWFSFVPRPMACTIEELAAWLQAEPIAQWNSPWRARWRGKSVEWIDPAAHDLEGFADVGGDAAVAFCAFAGTVFTKTEYVKPAAAVAPQPERPRRIEWSDTRAPGDGALYDAATGQWGRYVDEGER